MSDLKAMLDALGSDSQVAKMLGVARSTVNRLRNGLRHPSYALLRRIEQAHARKKARKGK